MRRVGRDLCSCPAASLAAPAAAPFARHAVVPASAPASAPVAGVAVLSVAVATVLDIP